MKLVIRDITLVAEMHKAVGLQREVWRFDDIDAVGTGEMCAVLESGGSLIGAFAGDELVGFTYGWIGLHDGHIHLHSHLAAVMPNLQGQNIGYQLKMAQRDRMLARGIDTILWTVDPLQSRNANLNFNKLGVYCDKYFVNFYGEETSSVLHTFGTDRFLVTWPLAHPNRIDTAAVSNESRALVTISATATPVMHSDVPLEGPVAIEIPADITAILLKDKKAALAWREDTRWAFLRARAAGYRIAGYILRERASLRFGAYLLTPHAEPR